MRRGFWPAIAVARSPSLFSLKSEPVEPRLPLFARVEKRGLGAAVFLLLPSSLWEAYRIVTGA